MDNGGLIIDNGDVPVVSYQFPLFFIILKSATIIQYTIKGRFMSR